MAKKNFKSGIDSLIQDTKKSIEVEKMADKEKSKAKSTKATYYLNAEILEQTKAIAYFERENISDIINYALEAYITNYELLEQAIKQYNKKSINKGS